MDSYCYLLNQETVKDYYAFPSQIPKAFFTKPDFFSCIELKNLKWILCPILSEKHWTLFAFELKKEKIHIYNSLPAIRTKKNTLKYESLYSFMFHDSFISYFTLFQGHFHNHTNFCA